MIATMCVMSATSFSAADTGFYVVGEMQGWAPATADPMTDNGDGTWTKVYTNLPVGAGGFKVIDAQSSDWDSFNQYNQDGNANFGKPDVKYEITEANSTMTIVFSETEMKVLSWEITAGEQPTGGSEATDPSEQPSATDATEASTAPAADTVTINGVEFKTGDKVVYTAYLKVAELAAGINVHVAYDGGLLKVSDKTLAAKKAEVIPVAYTGSCVLNFDPVDASNQVLFNSNDIDEGYDFTADGKVLITLTFDVIGTSGTGTIKAVVDELLGMTNADKENPPIADFELTDKTSKEEPVIPSETETATSTETETETATETQPVNDKVIINGYKYTQGSELTYTAYLKTSELAAGINVIVDYSGDLLKLSDVTLNAKKKEVIPVAYTGSSILNFAPIDGASQVLFNSNDIDEGYDFTVDDAVLITLKFDVTAASGVGSIKTNIVELLAMTNKDNQNLPITDYKVTEKFEGYIPDGTEPTETQPTQPTETQPTQPTETQPTQPTETQPTQPTETQPTQPTETQPTEPQPTQPTETQPTEPQPTQPTESQPTEPQPTQPTESQPTEPTDAPTNAPTSAPTVAPTQAPTQGPTNGGTTNGVTTGDSTSVAMLLAILMLAAGAIVVARKRVKE